MLDFTNLWMGVALLSLFFKRGRLPWVSKSSITSSLKKSRNGSFCPVRVWRSLQALTALTERLHVYSGNHHFLIR